MRYLLDSVILIDHFNGVAAASRFLAANGGECSISVITRAETLAGFDAASEPLARELLDGFVTLPVTVEVADTAGAPAAQAPLEVARRHAGRDRAGA